MVRLHGRAPRGERLRAGIPQGHWKTTTFVAGLRLTGIMATMVLGGPINRDAFQAYVEQVLVRELRPGNIVIMDNLSSHKGPPSARRSRRPAPACSSCSLQPGLQSDRERLRQAQCPAQSSRSANPGGPVGHHRQPHKSLHPGRMHQLLRRGRIRCNLVERL